MTWEYSEDNLIEQTAINLFYERLGWDTAIAFNKETFGIDSTLGRLNNREVILKRYFFEKLREARDILLPRLMNGKIEV